LAAFPFYESRTHLLYLDDSGSSPNPTEEHFVLGGVSVYEAQAHWFTQELDQLAQGIDSSNPHGLIPAVSKALRDFVALFGM